MINEEAKFGLVLLAHGSADRQWCHSFEVMARTLRQDFGSERVYLAYLQFAQPGLLDVVAEAVENNIRTIQILPLFMAGGGHVAKDIPVQVETATLAFPLVSFEVLPALGQYPEFHYFLVTMVKRVFEEARVW